MMQNNFKILSAIAAYSKQLNLFQVDVQDFISANEALALELEEAFKLRFNPEKQEAKEVKSSPVKGHELTFKIFHNLITKAIVRTNYFLNKPYFSFKVDLSLFDQTIAELPKPLTFREIFVFSEDFEAIHLRNGPIARGGLRWSDRKDDFRTEVLGLVKTQNTKNVIIVPVGSKGGFVIKKSTAGLSKEEALNVGKDCYRQFLYGCLDITDNVINGETITPKNIVIYENQDPYLAVAADKGTATFSDIANEISAKYNFWLGDAFASGGSNGYDHKKIGITSKGAWISVQRHFREIGIDVQKDEFTVVGIGDMSGDVFGNGLLRSKTAKLICAFNHMHIFLDPNPNTEETFKERERLFALPSSTWENFDMTKTSKGSALFKRSDASCKLTPEIKERFGIKEDALTPEELIKAILKSKFDLLWNGGIGTYVKASFETNEEVGDKINNVLRINGNELGAKVIGEGGNLGLTQKGRIEFALCGGKINTDAIDNSAGVDCSDHEVNIKILLNALVLSGKMTITERNEIIVKMTNDVEKLVLADNYSQTLLLSLEALNKNDIYSKIITELEKNGKLDRINEKLPTSEEISARYSSGKTLTKPEIAILIAYSKMEIYNSILNSGMLKDKYNEIFLIRYFPKLMQEEKLPEIKSHKLANEIACTVITKRIVNFAGVTFVFEMTGKSGKSISEVVRAYLVAEKLLRVESIFEDMKNSDGKISSEKQYNTLNTIKEKILKPLTLKILSEKDITDIASDSKYFEAKIGELQLSKDDLTLVDF